MGEKLCAVQPLASIISLTIDISMRNLFITIAFSLVLGFWASLAAESSTIFPQSVASGDPIENSVTLWTRVVDGDSSQDRSVTLKLSTEATLADVSSTAELGGDNLYTGGPLTAPAAHDGCVKLKVTDLQPDTIYYYQFTYDGHRSKIGRTKTAPAAATNRPVKFAVFNCADYSGRYYNTLKHLNDQEAEQLDFVVHLGDYIYETTVDPSFQTSQPDRLVSFSDTAGAIDFGNFFAARSVSNYRELYKTYRSDPHLQRAHELFPWVVIWDDHEYSDDNWGATATFFDGKVNEADVSRKQNAEQVWLEFIPSQLGLNAAGNQIAINPADLYPNLAIYRALNFGQNLDLIMTDNRTMRPDHLIPEDAFPGSIALPEADTAGVVEAVNGAGSFQFVRNQFDPYFDIDDAAYNTPNPQFGGATFKQVLTGIVQTAAASELAALPASQTPATDAASYAGSVASGKLSARWTNTLFAAGGFPEPFDTAALAGMERGISHFLMGKTANFIDFGARYQVVDPTFQIYAGFVYQTFLASSGALGRSQAFYEPAQVDYLSQALLSSVSTGRTWRVIGSSSPFTPIKLNLGDLPAGVTLPTSGVISGDSTPTTVVPQTIPNDFLVDFLVNADEVAGFPQFRQGIIDLLAATDALIISGDIHASMLGKNRSAENPGVGSTAGETVIDFTAPSTSSSNFRRAFSSALDSIEGLIAPGYRSAFSDPSLSFRFNGRDQFLQDIDRVVVHNSPVLDYLNTQTHGYLVLTAADDQLVGEFREIDIANISIDKSQLTAAGIDTLFTRRAYSVTKANGDLVCSPAAVTVAMSKVSDIKVGGQIVIPQISTSAGTAYKIAYTSDLTGSWTDVPAGDLLAVDGARIQDGVIEGTGETIAVIFKIPDALSGQRQAFFRAEVVNP